MWIILLTRHVVCQLSVFMWMISCIILQEDDHWFNLFNRLCFQVALLEVWQPFCIVMNSPSIYQTMPVWNAWVMLDSSWMSQFLSKNLFVFKSCTFHLKNSMQFFWFSFCRRDISLNHTMRSLYKEIVELQVHLFIHYLTVFNVIIF